MRFKILIGVPLLLAVLAAVLSLVNLGSLPLEDYDEAGYGLIFRSSFERNDFISLQYLGSPWFDKPPLLFLLMALSVKFFGFNEFALRLPSALLGIGTVILLYFLILRISQKNIWLAFFSGLFLILSPLFIATTRNLRTDVQVTFGIILALYFLILGYTKPRFLLGFWPGVAIAFMFKSVIGLLAIPVALIWSAVYKQWDWLKSKYFWLGSLIAAAIAAPWHIYMTVKFGGKFWQDYLGYHVFQRATENILASKITVGYYLWTLWHYSQPIILLAILSAAIIIWQKTQRDGKTELRLPIAAGLSALFLFAFFAFPKTKLITYFTPMYPMAALVFAFTLEFLIKRWQTIGRVLSILILSVSAYATVKEVFIKRSIFVTKYAVDERIIGQYLKEHHKGEEINIFDWEHHHTIRYYSEKSVKPLQFNTGRIPKPPFWLILPTVDLEENQFLKSMAMPYSGKNLTLIYFEE